MYELLLLVVFIKLNIEGWKILPSPIPKVKKVKKIALSLMYSLNFTLVTHLITFIGVGDWEEKKRSDKNNFEQKLNFLETQSVAYETRT